MINVRSIGGKIKDQNLRESLSCFARRRVVSAATTSSHVLFNHDRPSAANNVFPFVVSTRSRHEVSVKLSGGRDFNSEEAGFFQVPLTVSDVHLRHEQLPFAYFFRETLDAASLKDSLRRVLEHFPVVSGRMRPHTFQEIRCDPMTDTVPLAFGDINGTLDEWLSEARGHSHVSGSGHPELLPIFDPLFENESITGDGNQCHKDSHDSIPVPYDNLLKIRVTYFQCGGTAIGVNFLHALGDTASCVRFAQCWGREMQQMDYPIGVSNARATVCVSGMMTNDHIDLLGLLYQASITGKHEEGSFSWLGLLGDLWVSADSASEQSSPTDLEATNPAASDRQHQHEYLQLCFTPQVLDAMKEVGIEAIARDEQVLGQPNELHQSFTSTNDLVTAFGWLLKRSLSGEGTWNVSMVVNMRGRCGVDSFTDMNHSSLTEQKNDIDVSRATAAGVFGNGITNIVAVHPSTNKTFDIWDVASAARSIRRALSVGMSELPERLYHSRMGKASSPGTSTANSFPTTSWGQFPLGDVSFSASNPLLAFHGHPSHPLPKDQSTYSSVISRTLETSSAGRNHRYGVKYSLLLPSSEVDRAKDKHFDLCNAFLAAQRELQHEQL
jgi:hypothetical protein